MYHLILINKNNRNQEFLRYKSYWEKHKKYLADNAIVRLFYNGSYQLVLTETETNEVNELIEQFDYYIFIDAGDYICRSKFSKLGKTWSEIINNFFHSDDYERYWLEDENG